MIIRGPLTPPAWPLTSRDHQSAAALLGALDLLAADLDRVAEKHYIPVHFGLYLAVGRVNEELAAADLLGGYDGPEPFADEHQAEYLALCEICNRLARSDLRGMNMESARPGLLKNLRDDPNWTNKRFRGTGAYDVTAAFEEQDLFRFLTGDEQGDSQILYTGTASPQVASRWKAFRQEAGQNLAGNNEWESLVAGWLDEMSQKVGEGDVGLHVYNPCDLLQTIVHGWPDGLENLLPMVMGEAVVRAENYVHAGQQASAVWLVNVRHDHGSCSSASPTSLSPTPSPRYGWCA